MVMLCGLFTVDGCRKRWKNLRDTHRREVKKEKARCESGPGASTHRPWRYSQIMGFLNPFLEKRVASSGFPDRRKDPGDAQEATEETPSTSRERCRGPKRPHGGPRPPSERGRVDAATAAAPPDPDRQFLEGLLPDLKGLSARRKADVKFRIHKIIFEAACQEMDDISS